MAIKIGTKTGTSTTSLRDLGVGKIKIGFDTAASSSSGSSSSGGSSKTASASTASDADVLGAYVADMYARLAPEEIEYEAKTEEEIRASIAEWLRPSYDQAIANRQEQTLGYMAELDADAIARGMGASTYVTDVKNRQQNDEASDIATLESDYGATLAQYVSEGVESENDRLLEIQEFNAEQRQDAYDLAYAAALQLFQYYKKGASSSGGSGSGGKSAATVTATSAENCETFLSLLSGQQRAEVYAATTESGEQYRAELLASVGYAGYLQLQSQYPSTP